MKNQQSPDILKRNTWNRRKFIQVGSASVAGSLLAKPSLFGHPGAAPAPFDISFHQMGDPHYLALDTSTKGRVVLNPVIRENIKKMMELNADSPMPGAHGSIGKTLGLIDVGDCIEAGGESDPVTEVPLGGQKTREMQWDNYVKDLGLTGTEPGILINFPIYEGYGNHDQDGFVQGIIDRISERNPKRPNLTGISKSFEYPQDSRYRNVKANGLHYAWQWGPIHFIQANIRVGDGFERYPAAGSYTFVKDYLENVIGDSRAPVMIAVHLPPNNTGEGDWPLADRTQFYDLIKNYNTVGIFAGHSHSFNVADWNGPDNNGPLAIPVFRCDTIHRSSNDGGFMSAFRIKSNPSDPGKATLIIAQRMRNNTWGNDITKEIPLV